MGSKYEVCPALMSNKRFMDRMSCPAQKLPLETKFQITKYCAPPTLSSLALVASELQPTAEEVLYSAISVTADRIESLHRTFQTLATNPQKAKFVRFLTVEAMDSGRNHRDVETCHTYIAGQALLMLLPKLISLADLRLKFNPWCIDPLRNELGHVLKSVQMAVPAHLQTLFCNNWFDMEYLRMNLRDLQLLGIYRWDDGFNGPLLQILHHICNESTLNPLIFALGGITMPNNPYNHISLFPAFQTAGTDGILSRVLKPAIDRDLGTFEPLDCKSIGQLYVLFKTLDDTDYVSQYILDAAKCFPNIKILVLSVQRSSKLVSENIMTIIEPLNNLEVLYFNIYMDEEEIQPEGMKHTIDDKTKIVYAHQWEGVCPELETIHFNHGVSVRRTGSKWVVWGKPRFL